MGGDRERERERERLRLNILVWVYEECINPEIPIIWASLYSAFCCLSVKPPFLGLLILFSNLYWSQYCIIYIGVLKLTGTWGTSRFGFEFSSFSYLLNNLHYAPSFSEWTSLSLFLKWGHNYFSWDGSEHRRHSALMISSEFVSLQELDRALLPCTTSYCQLRWQ